jgi:hypothetical protein
MRLERTFWDTMKSSDGDAAASMTDTPSIVVGAQGIGDVDPQAMKGMMAGATWKLHSYEFEDPHVRLIGDNVAIVAYKVVEDLTVDGKRLKVTAHDSSVWRRQNGGWVCALHTESLAGDPFGRDRATSK